jgi:hypothetical protein
MKYGILGGDENVLESFDKIKEYNKMPSWVWNLSSNLTKVLLSKLGYENIILTSSTLLRDEIVRLVLHAGYSPYFTMEDSKWKISYTDLIDSEPILNKNNIKKIIYNGLTWCVTMPNTFIITRRVVRNENGIVVTASRPIITGQCQPSRMTIGQLVECVASKIGAIEGHFVDGTPYCDYDVRKMPEILEKLGYNKYGNETLYCGMTGRKMDAEIFMGPTYQVRLKHMTADKYHSRSRGPRQALTRQPLEGRSRDGGLKIGKPFCLSQRATVWLVIVMDGDTFKLRETPVKSRVPS